MTEPLYSTTQAAAVSGLAVKAVNNAIDKGIVAAVADPRHPRRRRLTSSALLRLQVWVGVGASLPNDRRQRLFAEMAASPTAAKVRVDDFLIVDVAAARRRLKARLKDLRDAEADIHSDRAIMGGEPVFKGTRVPARLVDAMLAQGGELDDILDGYPSLTPRRLELARIWTAAHPTRGRPKTLAEQGLVPTSVWIGQIKLSDLPDPLPFLRRPA